MELQIDGQTLDCRSRSQHWKNRMHDGSPTDTIAVATAESETLEVVRQNLSLKELQEGFIGGELVLFRDGDVSVGVAGDAIGR